LKGFRWMRSQSSILLRIFYALSDAAYHFAVGLSILMLALMTVSIVVGVFFRYVLKAPLAWPPELARYLMISVAFTAASVALRERAHVGLEFVLDRIRHKGLRLF